MENHFSARKIMSVAQKTFFPHEKTCWTHGKSFFRMKNHVGRTENHVWRVAGLKNLVLGLKIGVLGLKIRVLGSRPGFLGSKIFGANYGGSMVIPAPKAHADVRRSCVLPRASLVTQSTPIGSQAGFRSRDWPSDIQTFRHFGFYWGLRVFRPPGPLPTHPDRPEIHFPAPNAPNHGI